MMTAPNSDTIKEYYDDLAERYDQDRFENSYGRFIDAQERRILTRWLNGIPANGVLDIACGTGRFLNFASTGADISPEMIGVAKKKHPNHKLVVSDAASLPFESDVFDAVICFHLFMHLDRDLTRKIIEEVRRVLKPDGRFIVDVPSGHRRKLTGYKAANWHAGSNWYLNDLKSEFEPGFKVENVNGIAMTPIHRMPTFLRQSLVHLDAFICSTPLKKYASYWMLNLQKR